MKMLFVALLLLSTFGIVAPVAEAGGGTPASPAVRAYPRTVLNKAAEPVRRRRAAMVSVMSFNVCGAACRRGEVRRTAEFVASTALDHNASAVLLQELCFGQFVRVRELLAAKGYSAR